jgi:hypothetical protein
MQATSRSVPSPIAALDELVAGQTHGRPRDLDGLPQ